MYLVNSNGTQYGPYGLEEINQMLTSGQLQAEDFAWAEGMAEWQPLHALPGIRLPAMDPYAQRAAGPGPGPSAYRSGGYAGQQAPQSTSGAATASLIVGILSVLLLVTLVPGIVAGIVAIVLGHVARAGIKRSKGRIGGGGMALAGLICGYFALCIALLMAGAALGYSRIMDKGREVKMEANIATLESYIQMYTVKNNGEPPSNATGLRALAAKRILSDESLLTDPWGEPVEYKTPAIRSGKKYDVWSKGPDKISGNKDDIGNWGDMYSR